MFLHSEVLRYSSSASTIRPLFEYLFILSIEYFIIRVIHITTSLLFLLFIYTCNESRKGYRQHQIRLANIHKKEVYIHVHHVT